MKILSFFFFHLCSNYVTTIFESIWFSKIYRLIYHQRLWIPEGWFVCKIIQFVAISKIQVFCLIGRTTLKNMTLLKAVRNVTVSKACLNIDTSRRFISRESKRKFQFHLQNVMANAFNHFIDVKVFFFSSKVILLKVSLLSSL